MPPLRTRRRVRGGKKSQSKYTVSERDKYNDAKNLQQVSCKVAPHRNVQQRKTRGVLEGEGVAYCKNSPATSGTRFFPTTGDSFADLSVEVRGVIFLVPQFRLPRSFRNLDQAGQVGLVQRKSASQSMSLDTVISLSEIGKRRVGKECW